jgi:hypothetical protein
VFGDKALKHTQIYNMKKVKEGKPADKQHQNTERKKRILAFISDVALDIEKEGQSKSSPLA